VVARGGGSFEDLAAYNTELVARATYNCKKPIVSAVGHETDFTIIDFVSDLRAPTPSAAAELLTKDTKLSNLALKKDISRISRLLELFVADSVTRLTNAKNGVILLSEDYLAAKQSQISKIIMNLSGKLSNFVVEKQHYLELKLATLKKLNPLDILALGYAKIEQAGKTIASVKELDINKEIEINFIDGKVVAKGEVK